jgi:hypothetical protein
LSRLISSSRPDRPLAAPVLPTRGWPRHPMRAYSLRRSEICRTPKPLYTHRFNSINLQQQRRQPEVRFQQP